MKKDFQGIALNKQDAFILKKFIDTEKLILIEDFLKLLVFLIKRSLSKNLDLLFLN